MATGSSAGVSRSATVVASYLMKQDRLAPETALEQLRLVRPVVSPNPGFRRQLDVYHNILKRQQRNETRKQDLQQENDQASTSRVSQVADAEEVEEAVDLTKHYRTEKLRLVLHESGELPAQYFAAVRRPATGGGCFSCYQCRQPLFGVANVLPHATGEDVYRLFMEHTNHRRKDYQADRSASPSFAGTAHCTAVFVEPMKWMLESVGADDLKRSEGTFYCPKCRSRIGLWNWQGSHCSCGGHAVPAFVVTKNRVLG